MGTQIMWFRRDLRVHDNPALVAAAAAGPVQPIFVLDPGLLGSRRVAPARLVYLRHALADLSAQLMQLGATLRIVRGHPPAVLAEIAAALDADTVHFSADHSRYAIARDADVAARLKADGRGWTAHPGVAIQPPGQVRTGSGGSYKVFTPYSRRWRAQERRAVVPPPRTLRAPVAPLTGLAVSDVPELATARAPAGRDEDGGESAARARLDAWLDGPVDRYDDGRNLLAEDGTSRLSADLHLGCLSPLEVFERLDEGDEGQRAFGRQLIWRDFYLQVLAAWPSSTDQAFREDLRDLGWQRDDEALEAWQRGLTGYPLVDAGMRQLLATGWMHNRARMVVASFLCKDLLIDWRQGEAFFMAHLVDGDVANNVGGWQWAAGTGTDAQPFVRIFNPVTQSKRFDPGGNYIRRWVPELRGLDAPAIHEPWTLSSSRLVAAGVRLGIDYPERIVDHAEARQTALAWFERR